jgi:hypothetical protein
VTSGDVCGLRARRDRAAVELPRYAVGWWFVADWIAVTTEALVANTQRVSALDQAETTVRSK